MDERLRQTIERLARTEREIFPNSSLSKESQLDEYVRLTSQREVFWIADMLDTYARTGEDLLRNPIRRFFTHDVYKDRIKRFQKAADKEFCNEYGYDLIEN